jgi:glycerophosphoryl diester phosphodiesterase
MIRTLLALSLLLVTPACATAGTEEAKMANTKPIIIAHRGASGERPEHTIAGYTLAIEQGADYIEPDLVLTKDGVLVARHENAISETTDVAARAEFADRKATKTIDGQKVTDWFTEDFTLAELRTLRAKERLPMLRSANTAFDGQFDIPTFEQIIQLAQAQSKATGRTIGIYPETKHPSYFASIGLPHEAPLLKMLTQYGMNAAGSPVFIQSFEVGNLQSLSRKTKVKLIQLMDNEGGPADQPGTLYADMATPKGLTAIAKYADGIGPNKAMVIPRNLLGNLGEASALVADAHAVGLKVHPWTFRRENYFLPLAQKSGINPSAHGDVVAEIRAFISAGVDGFFSDNVAEAYSARAQP